MSDAVLPKLSRKHLLQALLGVVLALALLSFFLNRAEPTRLIRSFASLTLSAAVPALLCELCVQLSKALKWQAILHRVAKVRYSSALSAVLVGAASTHLLPLRLDEVLRAAVLARREDIAPGTVLGTVALDRIVELAVAGTILVGAALLLDLPDWMVTAAWGLGAVLLLALLGSISLVRGEARLRQWLTASGGTRTAWLSRGLSSVAKGLKSLPHGRSVLLVMLGTAGEWIATLLFYLWMLHVFSVSCGGEVPLIMSIGNSVAYMVPNVPGALGMYEGVQSGILETLAGLDPSAALALALSAHAILMIPVTIAGLAVGIWELRSHRPHQPKSAVPPSAAESP